MDSLKPTDLPLDELAARARAGDTGAESALFAFLRERFLAVAKRRVRTDDLEDVVQDSISIVHAKLAGRRAEGTLLVWSFAVLRNVVGNYYQKRERRDRGEPYEEPIHGGITTQGDADGTFPFDGTTIETVLEGISILARREPRCGFLFQRILESLDEGGSPREISGRAFERLRRDLPGISRDALYVALHRCRDRLREILRDRI